MPTDTSTVANLVVGSPELWSSTGQMGKNCNIWYRLQYTEEVVGKRAEKIAPEEH